MTLRSDNPVAYMAWQGMHKRCNANTPRMYRAYKSRGIVVCERWQGRDGFVAFLSDMGEPVRGLTLDRIDNDKGYSPGNCMWATTQQQSHNMQKSKETWDARLLRMIAASEKSGMVDVAESLASKLAAYRSEIAYRRSLTVAT